VAKFHNVKWRVYPYKQGSASAKALAEAVEGKVLKCVGSKYVPRGADVVVNWGAGKVPAFGPAIVLNREVGVAANKLSAFREFEINKVRIPEFRTNKADAESDLVFPVVCRTILSGHSGAGIVIAKTKEELVNAPLYTSYIKKKDEYRVHVIGEEAFFIQRKARKLDHVDPNWQVRNLAGGFAFVEVEEKDVNPDVIVQAKAALKALRLDFGGVDVLWNENEGKAYVLEVNTACGLEERTAERYGVALHNYVANR
jgi:glutathione synthase/RimK-type ligase-like ATP-grasp enzyme